MAILLDQPLLIEVTGADAAKILHNLTTNQVQNLEIGAATESFITDVRGWVVAHAILSQIERDRWWIVGQHPDSVKVANHIDRYIIREDAQVKNLSDNCSLRVEFQSAGVPLEVPHSVVQERRVPFASFGPTAELLISTHNLHTHSAATPEDIVRWDQQRIRRLWPKMGKDIWEKCIPQELDRNSQAISFTKGCYLGQETIARLDALGQIQKKLSLLMIESTTMPVDTLVLSGEKEVGSVSSAAIFDGATWALAVIKRGFFEVGTKLTFDGMPAVVQHPKAYCP